MSFSGHRPAASAAAVGAWRCQGHCRLHQPRAGRSAAICLAAQSKLKFVLGIESSCDDTAAAVVSSDGRVLSETVVSQSELTATWGGVVPNLARDAHAAAIDKVVDTALKSASISAEHLDAVAFTVGPGLSLCLRVGALKARQLSRSYQLPLIPVHHMEAHALVARLESLQVSQSGQQPADHITSVNGQALTAACLADESSSSPEASPVESQQATALLNNMFSQPTVQFPFLCLLVSGGHNLIVLVQGVGDYVQLGTTLDDALGEAYDKVARLLGLQLNPHGGAALEALAKQGNPTKFRFKRPLTQPTKKHNNCDFSYAGLKTSVRMAIEAHLPDPNLPELQQTRADLAASFQHVAVAHLMERTARAVGWARELQPHLKHLVVAGGVASNQYIRAQLQQLAAEQQLVLVLPRPKWCTDNGVMVAWAGIERLALGWSEPPVPQLEPGVSAEDEFIELKPRWPLTSVHHPKCTPSEMRQSAKRARIFQSLTDITRAGRQQHTEVLQHTSIGT